MSFSHHMIWNNILSLDKYFIKHVNLSILNSLRIKALIWLTIIFDIYWICYLFRKSICSNKRLRDINWSLESAATIWCRICRCNETLLQICRTLYLQEKLQILTSLYMYLVNIQGLMYLQRNRLLCLGIKNSNPILNAINNLMNILYYK